MASAYQRHVSGYMRRLKPRTMADARAAVKRAAADWSGRGTPRRAVARKQNPGGNLLTLALLAGAALVALNALGRSNGAPHGRL